MTTIVPHPNHEHLWKWGVSHDDGTYSHGPCVVRGCDRVGRSHIPQASVEELFIEKIPATSSDDVRS